MTFAQQYGTVSGPAFKCPQDMRSHCEMVLRGEYDVPGLEFDEPPYCLDIGANCGAFAVWAGKRWPGARVDCYEPNPQAVQYLRANRSLMHPAALIHSVAVRAEAGEAHLYFGKHNLGEASLRRGDEQIETNVSVECVAAATLPDADVIKIDTEGCEVEILRSYLFRRTRKPRAIVLEFHSVRDRLSIDAMLCSFDGETEFGAEWTLVRGVIHRPERGTLCYVRLEP